VSAPGYPYNSIVPIGEPRMRREPHHRIVLMATPEVELTIDEYLRKRLMPVEGAIPQLAGIDMYGNSIPASPVGTSERNGQAQLISG
jgi:hypothetical protein